MMMLGRSTRKSIGLFKGVCVCVLMSNLRLYSNSKVFAAAGFQKCLVCSFPGCFYLVRTVIMFGN